MRSMHNRQGKQGINPWPALYHAHHQLHVEDIPFWMGLAQDLPDPLLELGCGSGRIMLPLAGAGRNIFGIDYDADMLALIKEAITPAIAKKIHLLLADFTRFHLDEKFGLIFLPCNTLSTLTVIQQQALLARVQEHLSEGGVFAASLPNPYLLAHLPRVADLEVEEMFPHPIDGEPVQVSSAWERKDNLFVVHWRYDHRLPDGTVDRYETDVWHHIIPVQKHIEMWRSVGFQAITRYGDFDHSPYRKTSPHLIIIASR
jgi:SAM-dependent methyltransferase